MDRTCEDGEKRINYYIAFAFERVHVPQIAENWLQIKEGCDRGVIINESPVSHCCAVAWCSRAQRDVIKEDVITRRFHDKLQKVVFPSHSHSVSLSMFQVVLHAASVPPHRLLHDSSVSVRLWGSPVMTTSNSSTLSLSVFFFSLIDSPPFTYSYSI